MDLTHPGCQEEKRDEPDLWLADIVTSKLIYLEDVDAPIHTDAGAILNGCLIDVASVETAESKRAMFESHTRPCCPTH